MVGPPKYKCLKTIIGYIIQFGNYTKWKICILRLLKRYIIQLHNCQTINGKLFSFVRENYIIYAANYIQFKANN